MTIASTTYSWADRVEPEEASVMKGARQYRWLVPAVLGLILLLGAGVRLFELDRQTLTHPEAFVPGIDFPYDLAEPRPRLTLWKVLTGSIGQEAHPPAYYVVMLGWTKMFGTDLFVLRLPSFLFGVGSIFLVYVLGKREGGIAVGMLAAAMLALNGHHILCSQTAKMYAMGCFLGLLSTVLLLSMTRQAERLRLGLFFYSVSTLTGLATVVFYWPIFLTQMLWVVCLSARRTAMVPLLRWQLFLFILASPLCAVVAYQSRIPSHVVRDLLTFLSEFLQFGFLFEPDASSPLGAAATAAVLVLDLIVLVLLAVGLASKSAADPEAPVLLGPPVWLMASTGLAVLAVILVFAGVTHFWVTGVFDGRRTAVIAATGLIPIAVFALDWLLRRHWSRGQNGFLSTRMAWLGGPLSLSGLLVVVPITMIVVASVGVSLFASRGVMLYTPFLLVTASRGFMALVRWDRRWLVLGPVLAVAFPLSVYHFYHVPNSPRDCKALAEELAPRLRNSDLIFILKRDWQTTPIFYHLRADRYNYVGKDYAKEIAKHPQARVWAVTWEGNEMPAEMSDALRGYHRGERIEVRGGRAVLYKRSAAPGDGGRKARQQS
jgi:hypothetical protein